MKDFFGKDVLLNGDSAKKIYGAIKDLPIIDYHCHLNQYAIRDDLKFSNIGQMWLEGDHYKWRAMRMAGVDENSITGNASWKEKFFAYASVMPKLIGNPLYYMSHLELKEIFGITIPLSPATAEQIWTEANEKIKNISVRSLLKGFGIEYIATTDDPAGDLSAHGTYDGIKVCPTFRPDKLYAPTKAYLETLGSAAGRKINDLNDALICLENRLDAFIKAGCKISDHGFNDFPSSYSTYEEANETFKDFDKASEEAKDGYFGFLLDWLARLYAKRGIIMQLHYSVVRNANPGIFASQGVDRGCDIIARECTYDNVVKFLARFSDDERPEIIMYSLNPNAVPVLSNISGAFRRVKMGAAWWFNDSIEGIRINFKQVAEYALLGVFPGMLTDSRAFSSYARFDMFRRLLSDYIGDLVDKGEYDPLTAEQTAIDLAYGNIKGMLEKNA
ncbi:MAG: glucuronate isomerase [Clostridia bacterium]|nr:glucuronate isomerase [Clostridia bacterium]